MLLAGSFAGRGLEAGLGRRQGGRTSIATAYSVSPLFVTLFMRETMLPEDVADKGALRRDALRIDCGKPEALCMAT
jgi:hypothetical protein